MKLRIQRIPCRQKNFNRAHIACHKTGKKRIIPFFSRYGPGQVNMGRKTWYQVFSCLFRQQTTRATLSIAIICSQIALVSISFLLKYTQYGIFCSISVKIGQICQIWAFLEHSVPNLIEQWENEIRTWETTQNDLWTMKFSKKIFPSNESWCVWCTSVRSKN